MTDLAKLRAANEARWAAMRVTGAVTAIDATARRLVAPDAKARYQAVTARTGVPWFIIAVIHEREASQSWASNIAQGDPWNRASVHVPKGRGPFRSWIEAAVDALVNCAPYAARNKDWSAGGALTLLESYNGLGYANKGIPSPYIWASTDQYEKGKYVADGVFDPNAVDKQIGCAALLRRMMAIDPSIRFGIEVAPAQPSTPAGPDLSTNASPEVMGLQRDLAALGYNLAVDGVFGIGTEAAVERFQRDHGLTADGTVGPNTYAALTAATAAGAPKAPTPPPAAKPAPAKPGAAGLWAAASNLISSIFRKG
jgi:lysozyme family protein